MAKISQYPDGSTPQNTDQFILARAGQNFSMLWSSIRSALGMQYLPTATNDFLVGQQVSGAWTWVRKTLAEVKTILGLGSAAYLNVGTGSGDVAAGNRGVNIVWKDPAETALAINAQTTTIDWTDLDLTAYTSANARFAMISVIFYGGNYGSSGNNNFRIRKNGSSDTLAYTYIPSNQTTWVPSIVTFIIGLDAGQIMEYKLEVAAGSPSLYAFIVVLGYIE